jgi:arylsulfatase A-like enzyme
MPRYFDTSLHSDRQYMKQLKEIAPDKPFFIYYVPGATHAPHHPTPEWVKISDMHLFDEGWNKLREAIFANQKRLGIMTKDAKLTPWPASCGVPLASIAFDLPEWKRCAEVRNATVISSEDYPQLV